MKALGETDFYDIKGMGHPRTILFLTGAGFTSAWWTPQLEHLADNYQVIAPDLPGHGRLASEKFGVKRSVDYIQWLFANVITPPALIVGISLGGYIAIDYAARRRDHVAGLALSGSTLNLSGLTGLGFKLTGLMLRVRGTAWLAEANLRSFRKRVDPALGEPIIAAGFHPEAAVSALFGLSGTNFHRKLARYPGPILLLNGEGDDPNCAAERKLLRAVPHAQSRPVAGAGHLTNLEQPAAFSQAIADFASTLTWTTTPSASTPDTR